MRRIRVFTQAGRRQIFDASVKILTPRHLCENPKSKEETILKGEMHSCPFSSQNTLFQNRGSFR